VSFVIWNVQPGNIFEFRKYRVLIYRRLTISLELSSFHESLWKRISPTGSSISALYRPKLWTPHITLAQSDIDERNLPKVVGRPSRKDLELGTMIVNLAIIFDNGTNRSVPSKIPARMIPKSISTTIR